MLKTLLTLALVCMLFACSSLTDDEGIFRDRKYDYRRVEAVPRMVIPEGLDTEAIVDYYAIPPASPYAEQETFDKLPFPVGMVGESESAVKIQKMGQTQWILLQIPASQVWPRLKEFISLQSLSLTAENGNVGMIETSSGEGVYRFRIEQGFQRNTSEVSVRFLAGAVETSVFWPESSSDAGTEQLMVEQLALFFADVSGKPAYSFAAQGITAQKKLLIETREDGSRVLLLSVPYQRAQASLKLALEKAGFTIEKIDANSSVFSVRYTPQLAEDDQPGFFSRLVGFKRKPFDEDAEYAGNHYLFLLGEANGAQRVEVKAVGDGDQQDPAALRSELNQQLLLVKGHFF